MYVAIIYALKHVLKFHFTFVLMAMTMKSGIFQDVTLYSLKSIWLIVLPQSSGWKSKESK
jgi:hypothetical protein